MSRNSSILKLILISFGIVVRCTLYDFLINIYTKNPFPDWFFCKQGIEACKFVQAKQKWKNYNLPMPYFSFPFGIFFYIVVLFPSIRIIIGNIGSYILCLAMHVITDAQEWSVGPVYVRFGAPSEGEAVKISSMMLMWFFSAGTCLLPVGFLSSSPASPMITIVHFPIWIELWGFKRGTDQDVVMIVFFFRQSFGVAIFPCSLKLHLFKTLNRLVESLQFLALEKLSNGGTGVV